MVQGISGKNPGLKIIPSWQVDSEETRPLPIPNSAMLPTDAWMGFVVADIFDRFRIQKTLRKSPQDQPVLLEDTQTQRAKILDCAWKLHQGLYDSESDAAKFIQGNLFAPWNELEIIRGNDDDKVKNKFSEEAKNILELRKAIHSLKVIALKRGEGPEWVEGQLRLVCEVEPFMAMLLMPVYYASASVPDDPIARLQNISLQKGYQLYFGPFPLDPLLGRPEFLALRWIQRPELPNKIFPQWGVLSEDGFFNTETEALQRMTGNLGLYTLPDNTRHNEFLHYARIVKKIHDALYEKHFEEARPLIETAQVMAQNLFLPADYSYFSIWRGMTKPPVPPTPMMPGEATVQKLPEDQQETRRLDCKMANWNDVNQDACLLAFSDQSGKKGIYDGQDQWGYFIEDGTFDNYPGYVTGIFKTLGLKAIPSGTPYNLMDEYARHFNHAYQIASGKTLVYPANSFTQIVDDLVTSFDIATDHNITVSIDRFRRVVQDGLMIFWETAPELFNLKFDDSKRSDKTTVQVEDDEASIEEEVKVLENDDLVTPEVDPLQKEKEIEVANQFTLKQGLIEKERKSLKRVVPVLGRNRQELWNQFSQIGLNVLEQHLSSQAPKASRSVHYAVRLLLTFLKAKELEGYVAVMEQRLQESVEKGQPNEVSNWKSSLEMILQPLGRKQESDVLDGTLQQAYLNQRTRLIKSLQETAGAYFEAMKKFNRQQGQGPSMQGNGDQSGVPSDPHKELKKLQGLLRTWEENARKLGEDPDKALSEKLGNPMGRSEAFLLLRSTYASLFPPQGQAGKNGP